MYLPMPKILWANIRTSPSKFKKRTSMASLKTISMRHVTSVNYLSITWRGFYLLRSVSTSMYIVYIDSPHISICSSLNSIVSFPHLPDFQSVSFWWDSLYGRYRHDYGASHARMGSRFYRYRLMTWYVLCLLVQVRTLVDFICLAGTIRDYGAIHWYYGQFDQKAIDVAFKMLEKMPRYNCLRGVNACVLVYGWWFDREKKTYALVVGGYFLLKHLW